MIKLKIIFIKFLNLFLFFKNKKENYEEDIYPLW